jgi:hypothetical protein
MTMKESTEPLHADHCRGNRAGALSRGNVCAGTKTPDIPQDRTVSISLFAGVKAGAAGNCPPVGQ